MDRSSYRGGKHPPYCTCVKCENRRRKGGDLTSIVGRFIASMFRIFKKPQ